MYCRFISGTNITKVNCLKLHLKIVNRNKNVNVNIIQIIKIWASCTKVEKRYSPQITIYIVIS